MSSISTSKLDELWREAKALKSYHDLLKFIETLPDSKSRVDLKESVEKLLLCEGTETKYPDTDEPTTVVQVKTQPNDAERNPWAEVILPDGSAIKNPYFAALKAIQDKNRGL